MAVRKTLAWDRDRTPEERAVIERVGGGNIDTVSWSTDLSGGIQRVALRHGCHPYGNGKARAKAWNLPDPIPVHREPIYTPRVELVEKYRSEEHTSELQSLMRISYAVFCLKKKTNKEQ